VSFAGPGVRPGPPPLRLLSAHLSLPLGYAPFIGGPPLSFRAMASLFFHGKPAIARLNRCVALFFLSEAALSYSILVAGLPEQVSAPLVKAPAIPFPPPGVFCKSSPGFFAQQDQKLLVVRDYLLFCLFRVYSSLPDAPEMRFGGRIIYPFSPCWLSDSSFPEPFSRVWRTPRRVSPIRRRGLCFSPMGV